MSYTDFAIMAHWDSVNGFETTVDEPDLGEVYWIFSSLWIERYM